MTNKNKIISALLIIICVICIAVFFISRANAYEITVESNHSHTAANTVHPGSEITYNYTIKNNESEEISLTVKDIIPKNTEYVTGCENITKNKFRWELSIPSGESKTISYTVKVLPDMTLCDGMYVQNKSFKIDGKKYASPKIYIERTFNKFDQEKVAFTIKSHTGSIVEGSELAKAIYNTAFSQTFELDGSAYEVLEQVYGSVKKVEKAKDDTEEEVGEEVKANKVNILDMVIPTIYGGEEISKNPGKEFRGEKNNLPSSRDFITGDILIAQKNIADVESAKMYMYNGKEFVELLVESKKTMPMSF